MQSINQGVGKSGSSELRHSGSEKAISPNANGSMDQTDRLVEFGSFGALPMAPACTETSKQKNPGSPNTQNSTGTERLKSAASIGLDRIFVQPFHLKNEDDFPPLSL
ncbi:hypothetical protein Gohar_008083 [Gossypium harknessii]|uniref:Uncharacterized protein n=1 Tax=Gossypium harknessii TaxID=34285 RepID=A0A7J9GJT0_9ROSI|nr:hypothetical protein [Gossypium harknessii]